MHNRALTVALSIIAFIATAGLVIAASPTRYGSTTNAPSATAPVPVTTAAKAIATVSTKGPKNPWLGVDPTMEKPFMSLKPRTPKAKAAKVERSNSANGSRLVVKFNDDVRLRTLPNGRLLSLTGKDIT
ncbi:MAG: hypothetical protein P8L37_01525, partial [Phycisphaerales bacterium]|nr:hypothetical protein [Phycisphaerales bacterium]